MSQNRDNRAEYKFSTSLPNHVDVVKKTFSLITPYVETKKKKRKNFTLKRDELTHFFPSLKLVCSSSFTTEEDFLSIIKEDKFCPIKVEFFYFFDSEQSRKWIIFFNAAVNEK